MSVENAEELKTEEGRKESLNFIEEQLVKDLAEGKNGGRMQTRFPPEPNGYLHIGHAKAIALDKMARAIRAYETMRTIVVVLDKDGVEKAANNRGMMQDSHKFALTSIGEYFPTTTLWREFEEPAQKRLGKYADDAQSAIMLMEPLSLESAIHNIFAEQKECLEKIIKKK